MSNACRLTDRKRTLIFLNIMISCIASSMLATALTTALPPIIQDLNRQASPTWQQCAAAGSWQW
ncbi:MAG: hypothetical protein ACLTLQ_08230 [[Clostridium] scindens]